MYSMHLANWRLCAQELRKQFQIISELRSEIKNLQADNLKLYEKVRYMQSYREESGSRPLTTQLNPLPTPPGRADDMSKYRARYEEAMNPFEAFRGRVSSTQVPPYLGLIAGLGLGSNSSISEPQSCRARGTRAHTSDLGQSPSADFFHLLCPRTPPPGHVHVL